MSVYGYTHGRNAPCAHGMVPCAECLAERDTDPTFLTVTREQAVSLAALRAVGVEVPA